MRGINQVHYIGSIVQAPELKYTPDGLAILELTVAGKQEIVTADGAAKSVSFYNRCKCFGKYAESLADGLQQGDVVSVHGRLEYRSWEGNGGEKRSTVETVITTIGTLEGGFITEDDRRGQPVLTDGLNSVTIGGNLTKSAELKHLATGNSVTRLSVAVSERYTGKEDEKVGYFDLQGWGELAEMLGEGGKGDGIIGVGCLVNESWEDRDGNKRYGTKVKLERAHFVSVGRQTASKSTPKPSRKGARKAPRLSLEEKFPPEDSLPF